MALNLTFWNAGDNHFLVSDNTRHLASGWHSHGTAASQPRKRGKSLAMREEELLMTIVKEFVKNTI